MKGIEAVSFDFFQTLACHRNGDGGRGRALMDYLTSQGFKPNPWEHQVLYDVLEPHAREYSPQHSPAEKQAYFNRLAERVFSRLGIRHADAGPARHADAEPARHADAIWQLIGPQSLQIFPDVCPALRELRSAGYRLIIISNWQCGLAHFCTELGIGEFFEHVCASAEIACEKPNREIFAEASRRLMLQPDRILHVGDSLLDDVEGARGAGMRAAWIDRTEAAPESAEVIRSLDEVLQLLKS